MVTTTVFTMPRGAGGRPKAGEGEKGTRQVRVFSDLADMIGWIVEIKGGSSAQIIDTLARSSIVAQYAEIEEDVKRVVRAREAAERAKRDAVERFRKKPPGDAK